MKKLIFTLAILSHLCYSQVASLSLSDAAVALTQMDRVKYDPTYYVIDYPMGDLHPTVGVCTDVVIRAYRNARCVELQELVHKDMRANFDIYPKIWGLKKPDTNIDHRRVPNLMTFFSRFGQVKSLSEGFEPGDIVCWDLGVSKHIGIVVDIRSEDGERYMIAHNIGTGQVIEDFLFEAKIIGHYKY